MRTETASVNYSFFQTPGKDVVVLLDHRAISFLHLFFITLYFYSLAFRALHCAELFYCDLADRT